MTCQRPSLAPNNSLVCLFCDLQCIYIYSHFNATHPSPQVPSGPPVTTPPSQASLVATERMGVGHPVDEANGSEWNVQQSNHAEWRKDVITDRFGPFF